MTINGGKALAAARREAKAIIGAVAKGGDPLGEKRKDRESRLNTLRAVVEERYFADPDIKKLRTYEEKRAIFGRYFFQNRAVWRFSAQSR